MTLISILIYPLLTLSLSLCCYAMEWDSRSDYEQQAKIQIRMGEKQKDEDETLTRKRRRISEEDIPKDIPKDISKILDNKANVLKEELPKIVNSLQEIIEKLKVKARENKDQNFELAAKLAVIASHANFLSISTSIILHKLYAYADSENGLSIISSSALKNEINKFINVLKSSEDAKGIEFSELKELEKSNKEVEDITKDIEINLEEFNEQFKSTN